MRIGTRVSAFTLIELVIVIVITSVMVLGLGSYIKQTIDIWNVMSYRSGIVSDVRLGVLRMGKNIRQLNANNGVGDIFDATDSSFGFSVANSNGVKYLRYWYDAANNTVLYGESNSSNITTGYPFMDNVVDSDLFDYFDGNMTATNNAVMIKYIRIKPRLSYRGQNTQIDYDVNPRNVRIQ